MKNIPAFAFTLFLLTLAACSDNKNKTNQAATAVEKSIQVENITYTLDTFQMNGFLAYDHAITEKRPAILIIHEWWGLTDYPKNRAKQLANSGYVAFAIDLYGNGKTAVDPDAAKALAMPLYMNPLLAKSRFDAALAKIKTYAAVDTTKIATIGYCFGGAMALNVARLGAPLKGVVCFHGNLIGVPLNKNLLQADVLICHGAADDYVNGEVAAFKKEMDQAEMPYTFKSYANALHAFTNPEATEKGKTFSMDIAYNAAADTASFNDMRNFFDNIFK